MKTAPSTPRQPTGWQPRKRDLTSILAALKEAGAKVAEVGWSAEGIRVVTTDGTELTPKPGDDELDREHAEYRKKRGYSAT